MSENLKRLREREKKIAEKSIDRQRRKVTLPYWHERYYPLAGMSQIEELERKAEEACKEEERVKEQFKEETKGIMEVIVRDFERLMLDEYRAIDAYEKMLNVYGKLGWRRIFSDILNDEKEHFTKLRISLEAIKETYKKKGEIPFE